jgi:HEAT repeat protein
MVNMPSILNAQQDSTLFFEAKALMFQQQHQDALNLYELLKMKYPDSKYSDDSEFWSAYILEQQGKKTYAFNMYQDLIQKYPGSPWADDAMVHQIGLAEKFIQEGQATYLNFLNEKLESPYKNVKYQAALSLGKFQDQRAVPALHEMSNNGDRDMRSIATSLLKSYPSQPPGIQKQDKPIKIEPPKSKVDKKDDAIKTPRLQPKKERPGTTAPPNIKRNQPPKQTSPKTKPPKTSAPPKKGKIG